MKSGVGDLLFNQSITPHGLIHISMDRTDLHLHEKITLSWGTPHLTVLGSENLPLT